MIPALDQSLTLGKLVDAQGFREICRSFSELYGIGIRVFDDAGRKIVDVRASTADHCGYLFTVHPTKVLCTALVNEIRAAEVSSDKGIRQFECFSGLRYNVMPILHDGDVLGRVIFGPFAPSSLEGPPDKLAVYEPQGLDLGTLARYQKLIPRVQDTAVARVLENIENVLDVIIHSGFKAYLTSQMHIASISHAFEDVERSNQSLATANERLKDLDRLKSNFIATVSHELRTPLTSVIGYSEMLLEGMAGAINDEQKSYVGTILEKGESLLALIGQVLDLSRIESGNADLRPEEVAPIDIVTISVSDVAPQAHKRGITVEVEVEGEDDVLPITVDRDKIRRVLTNLLGNAVKFTPNDGRIVVRLRLTKAAPVGSAALNVFEPSRNQYLCMEVTDSGIGIPKDKLDRVFESFFQVDNSSTREFGGSGLGLSIAQNFVRAHSGRIEIESEEGKGSTFRVLLPYVTESPTAEVGIDGVGGTDRPITS